MRTSEVYLAIPTANAANCRRHLPRWREMGYNIAVLRDSATSDQAEEIPADIVVWVERYMGWAASVNYLCREVIPASCQVVVTGGDDMLPDPNHTAEELASQFLDRFPDTFGVMQPHGDEFLQARNYCGSPWLGRAWCEKMYGGKGPLWPGYWHNWADNELFWLSKCMGVLWERPDLSHHHVHFSREGKQPAAYWSQNVSGKDRQDVQTFIARSWLGFPEHAALGAVRAFDAELFKREYGRAPEAYWMSRYGGDAGANEAQVRMKAALEMCAKRNQKRVAIMGAGTHTRECAAVLMEPAVKVVAIIDDNPLMHGKSLWNYPIVSVQGALELQLDAVILSSKAAENQLAASAAPLANRGVSIVRLYESHKEAA